MAIGIDLVDVSRFEEFSSEQLKKIFTKDEISYCESKQNPLPHYAARFACKEAIFKAFSSLGIKLSYRIIEIKNKESGLPYAKFRDQSINYIPKISMSHTRKMAIAIAMIDI